MNTWSIVLTSSAVAVLVSGVVTLIGQSLERRSRRNELLLSKALEMAIRKSEVILKALEMRGEGRAHLADEVVNAETYFRWLKSILVSGKLPSDAPKREQP